MTQISRDEFISIFPLFSRTPEGVLSGILAGSVRKAFPAGRHIYSEGDTCRGIAFLLSGEIRVFKTGESGREITLYEIGRGDTCILNASCILSDTSYPANAVSTKPGEMLLVEARLFRRLIAEQEEMREFVFRLLAGRLASVMALVEEVAFGRMDGRLLFYLTERAKDGRIVTTHQNIASDLGTSREVVSRLLKHFEAEGRVLLSRNSIRLIN